MASETLIKIIRKDVKELKAQMVVLKAEVEGLKISHQVAKPMTTKGGKK